MEYIKDGGTLPPPINIIPTPKSVIYMFKKLVNFFSRKKENSKNESCNFSDHFHLVTRIFLINSDIIFILSIKKFFLVRFNIFENVNVFY